MELGLLVNKSAPTLAHPNSEGAVSTFEMLLSENNKSRLESAKRNSENTRRMLPFVDNKSPNVKRSSASSPESNQASDLAEGIEPRFKRSRANITPP